ncbi:MAG: kdkA 1 [Candidatus Brocadiaceae bacterium]|nr:kdkA 1 [Candidatus Brocadiaceae bacterium]
MHKEFTGYLFNNIQWVVKDLKPDVFSDMMGAVFGSNGCEIIRSEPYKKIQKYTKNNESFFIKQYVIKSGIDAVKSVFVPSKAKKEWNNGLLLLKKQISTPEPIALGERRRLGVVKDCYIITRAIPDSVTGKERLITLRQLPEDSRSVSKGLFLKKLISYVKTLHACGLYHGELHAENVLVGKNGGDFYLIDLGRLKCREKTPTAWKIYDLSRLLYSILDVCSPNEITSAIDDYAGDMSNAVGKRSFHAEVFEQIRRIKQRHGVGKTKKCLRNNELFKTMTYNKYTINMRREWDIAALEGLLCRHTDSLEKRRDNVIKFSHKTAITHLPLSDESGKLVCVKEYRYPSAFKKCFYPFFRSPAWNAWFAAHGLIAADVLTPKPIALIEEKRTGMIKKSFLITEGIFDCRPCYKYIRNTFGNREKEVAFPVKRRFAACLAASFRQLHDAAIYHGDLKESNIIVRELPDAWDFYYIDLDRVYFNKNITRRRKIKNLSQLNASVHDYFTRTDRLRFYKVYAGVQTLGNKDKQIVKAIIALSKKRNVGKG